jgi:Amidase
VLGLGEETGGSIQNPAATQALVGIKPTFGLVPNTGVVPLGGSTRDVIGREMHAMRQLPWTHLLATRQQIPRPLRPSGIFLPKATPPLWEGASLRGKRIGLYGPGWLASPLSEETRRLGVQDPGDGAGDWLGGRQRDRPGVTPQYLHFVCAVCGRSDLPEALAPRCGVKHPQCLMVKRSGRGHHWLIGAAS